MSLLLISENLALCELKVKQIRNVFRASLAVYIYSVKDDRIRELCVISFAKSFFLTLLNGEPYLQLVLSNCQEKVHVP